MYEVIRAQRSGQLWNVESRPRHANHLCPDPSLFSNATTKISIKDRTLWEGSNYKIAANLLGPST